MKVSYDSPLLLDFLGVVSPNLRHVFMVVIDFFLLCAFFLTGVFTQGPVFLLCRSCHTPLPPFFSILAGGFLAPPLILRIGPVFRRRGSLYSFFLLTLFLSLASKPSGFLSVCRLLGFPPCQLFCSGFFHYDFF